MSEEEIKQVICITQYIIMYTFDCYNLQRPFDQIHIKQYITNTFQNSQKIFIEYYSMYTAFLPTLYEMFSNTMNEYKKICGTSILSEELKYLFDNQHMFPNECLAEVTDVYTQHDHITREDVILACKILSRTLKDFIEFYDEGISNSNSLVSIICAKNSKVFEITIKICKLIVFIFDKVLQGLNDIEQFLHTMGWRIKLLELNPLPPFPMCNLRDDTTKIQNLSKFISE